MLGTSALPALPLLGIPSLTLPTSCKRGGAPITIPPSLRASCTLSRGTQALEPSSKRIDCTTLPPSLSASATLLMGTCAEVPSSNAIGSVLGEPIIRILPELQCHI